MSLRILISIAVLAALLAACSKDSKPEVVETARATLAPSFMAPDVPISTPLPAKTLNDGCPASQPNGAVPPGERPENASNVLGNGAVFVGLYPDGTVVFGPDGPGSRDDLDGSLSMKFWWWRGVEGRLEITGRRLDGDAPPLEASIRTAMAIRASRRQA
jgi:hypothetical protein